MAKIEARPIVYEYLDYRQYLAAFYRHRKTGRGFSYRSFAKTAGVRAPNYLKLVIEGERNLSAEFAGRFAGACQLDGEEAAYFCDLVAFAQATTGSEKKRHYDRLSTFRRYRQAQKIEMAHAAYHADWYVPAIRELVVRNDFVEDPVWISRVLKPSITKGEAAGALRTLLSLKMLVRDSEGRLCQAQAIVSTGAETRGLHIWNYHRTMMNRASAALDLFAADERDISALTLCLDKEGLKQIKREITEFRRRLLHLSIDQQDPKQVVQINFQLFPLSKVDGSDT